ncbi:MAG: transketolase [Haloplasmataceae bacterium]|nr:transketolase [Haloplasmataceae bacterium]
MISNLSINTIRVLGIDAINKANSGHPGIVLGAAPMAYTLWTNHLNVNPHDPQWVNRDRFVLAAGHGSMLLYGLLHLSGFNVTIDDLKSFRQLGSKTPGHPEYGHTDGVDATTGPLGQGIPMAIGMAMAERYLATKYNKEDIKLFDHFTYALCGDGDLMEGVTNEAASLAGHLKLGKLIVLYDSNEISLDGETSQSFSEKTTKKYEAIGWHVQKVEDGTDVQAINQAINNAKNQLDKPSLIEVRTVIGYGAPNQGTNKVHGAPLGVEGGKAAKTHYEWNHEEFNVPQEVYRHFNDTVINRGTYKHEQFQKSLKQYEVKYPNEYLELMRSLNNKVGVDLADILPIYGPEKKDATRNYSYECLNKVANVIPNLIGGAADLTSSTKAIIKNADAFSPANYSGRNIYFGVREFAMASISNGIALHGGLRVFCSTFFVFSDYFKPAVRMAAIMKLPVIYILTHDSVAVGEDGPTHEPIEQLAMLRSIPNIQVLRPCDGNETAACYKLALETTNKPTVLVLTRQNLPTVTTANSGLVKKGGYIVSESKNTKMDGILIASGSEVSLAIAAQKQLEQENINTRVVSIVSMELFDANELDYKESVLPKNIRTRLSIEMGSSFGWHKYVGLDGNVMSIDTFGASGEGNAVIEKFGFTVNNVVKEFKELLK